MYILLVSATKLEVAPLIAALDLQPSADFPPTQPSLPVTVMPDKRVELLITGVGAVSTALALGRRLVQEPKPDLVLNLGVAGCYNLDEQLGTVVEVLTDCFADLGAENSAGTLIDLEELGLPAANHPAFGGFLFNTIQNSTKPIGGLKLATGLTVNTVSGSPKTIAQRIAKFGDSTRITVETMEGAAVMQAAAWADVPCHCVRAISNYVEPRNPAAWQMKAAIEALNRFALDFLQTAAC